MTYGHCPKCGEAMRTRTSRKLGTRIERYRECKNEGCDYEDVAVVKPEEIISVRLLCTQQRSVGDGERDE